MKQKPSFFDFAAEVGLTKHIGGIYATDKLVELCQVNEGNYLLDVGCGVGATPCYIAKKYGCKVMGVDIKEEMVKRSLEKARKENLLERVDFRVGDAQDLPFPDDTFDVVITESVTAFPEDKQKAVHEYARVIKPGGFAGLNESTWLKLPPPSEMVEWASQDLGASVKPMSLEDWVGFLENAGLRDIISLTFPIDLQDEAKGIVKRYGNWGFLSIMGRMLSLYVRDSDYRKFVKEVQRGGITPKNLDDYFGYGLYVGRK